MQHCPRITNSANDKSILVKFHHFQNPLSKQQENIMSLGPILDKDILQKSYRINGKCENKRKASIFKKEIGKSSILFSYFFESVYHLRPQGFGCRYVFVFCLNALFVLVLWKRKFVEKTFKSPFCKFKSHCFNKSYISLRNKYPSFTYT